MSEYKGFDINTNLTAPPWGTREQQVIEDLIDNIVVDAVGAVSDVSGHKHDKLYDAAGGQILATETTNSLKILSGDDGSTLKLMSDSTEALVIDTDSTYNSTISTVNSSAVTLTIIGQGGASLVTGSGDITITAGGSGLLLISSVQGSLTTDTANDMLLRTASGDLTIMAYGAGGVLHLVGDTTIAFKHDSSDTAFFQINFDSAGLIPDTSTGLALYSLYHNGSDETLKIKLS
jgi:hypothetical protein